MRNVKLQDIKQMVRYESVNGEGSMITAYGIGRDFIRLQIENRNIYRYSYASTGKDNVETMKKMLQEGQLDDFLTEKILNSYESREM